MKLYIPFIGDIIKLSENWTFSLYHDYVNQYLLKEFDVKITNVSDYTKITLNAGTELQVKNIYINKISRNSKLTFSIYKSENIKKNIIFSAKLTDVNRIELKSNPTLGVLKFHIKWSTNYNIPEKGTIIYGDYGNIKNQTITGSVNDINVFLIIVNDFEMIPEKNKIKNITYKLIFIEKNIEIGQWSTISTMKKKAENFINKNKKYFLNDEQKITMRTSQLERILNN